MRQYIFKFFKIKDIYRKIQKSKKKKKYNNVKK